MKTIIIGAGISGIIAAINIKLKDNKSDVLVLNNSDEPLKKLLMTGNGKCNIGNKSLFFKEYNNELAEKILSKINTEQQIDFLKKCNVYTKESNNLLYPINESAQAVKNNLLKTANELGIKIINNVVVNDYICKETIEVITSDSSYYCDKLIIAVGGLSYKSTGSDGSLYPILKKHKYSFVEAKPILCPIKVKENVKELDGVRVKANVKVGTFNEDGELLFKKDGLSGIVIFNATRHLIQGSKITIDLLPSLSKGEINSYLVNHSEEEFFNAFINPKLGKYLIKYGISAVKIKELQFTFKDAYGYEFAQATSGGISLDNIKNTLESKLENNVYFIGEVLDIDGPCGGYNISWAIGSALLVTN